MLRTVSFNEAEEKILVELLAPAGSKEALIAAVESGANAVYLAGNMFGARAYANNFDEEGLREAIRFAHMRNVHVHVTVNTIVADEELPELADYVRFLYEAGADAILVQDLGVARIVQQAAPDLPMHASTQMTVHNLAGVLALQKLGFSRVVLSRELSLKDIRYICANSQAEIEVFMHGALCVCYSGQCLMSSMIGGRSGNRGRCAQPCRLPYTLVDENGEDVLADSAGQYLLSPRDLNTIDILPELIAAGVSSLKIEGRMKRPEYVAVVVNTYRRAIDSYLLGSGYEVSDMDRKSLAQIFNRDFTTAYLKERPGRNMMSDRRPNNRGLLIGRVEAYDWDIRRVTVKLSGSLAEGDQVDFWVKVGGRVTATIQDMQDKNGKKLTAAEAGESVSFPIPSAVRDHDRVFKVFDASLMERAREFFNTGAPVRRIPVQVRVTAAVGRPLQISMTDADGYAAQADTEFIGEEARKRPLSEETIRKQVARLGSTVYALDELVTEIEGNVMVPVSEINEARRKATESLEAQRLQHFARPALPAYRYRPAPAGTAQKITAAQIIVSVDTVTKAEAALTAGADGVLFGGESYRHEVITPKQYEAVWKLARNQGRQISYNTPRIINEMWMKSFVQLLESFKAFPPDSVYVHNIAALSLVQQAGLPVHVDASLIVYNHASIDFLQELGAKGITLSPELTLQQAGQLAAGSPLPVEAIVAGRLELMVSEYCVTGSFLGGIDQGPCSRPCLRKGARYALKDRKNMLFPLVMDQFCHMHVLNSKTLSMLPHAMKFAGMGIGRLRIEGKAMSSSEIADAVRNYKEYSQWTQELLPEQLEHIKELEGEEITRGHYFRGVL